jgi:hypothetical protein
MYKVFQNLQTFNESFLSSSQFFYLIELH